MSATVFDILITMNAMDREFNKRLTKDIFIRKDRINEVCETEMIQEMLRALTDESLVERMMMICLLTNSMLLDTFNMIFI